jgi:acetyltransferase
MGEAAVEEARASFAASRIPCFATPETAVGAFSYLAAHYRHRQMLLQAPAPLSDRARADPAAARAVMDSALAQGRAALTEGESERVLAAFGIPVAPTIVVKSADEAVDTARAIGYPVVMKIHGAGLAGKSNHGGVILGLADARAVAAAWHSIRGNLAGREAQPHLHDIVIQPMCRKANGRELIVGVRRDPVFGPVITCSAGGLFGTAPWGEAIALPPLNAFLARDLIERTRIAPMLGEFRGMPAIDFIALDDLLLRVSDMVCELPSIERMDIDPVFADETGVVVLDARIGLVPRAERRRGHYAHMAIHPYPAELEEQWQTRGGATVTIRPIRPEDAGIEQAFVRSLSTQTKFFRFLDVINELSPEMLSRFTQIDYDREMALIAVHFDAGIETQVAVSRYVTNPDGQSCEFAVVVADAWRRHGLGVKLMEKLMACARAADLKVMEGDVLGDNHVMLGMMRHLGFSMRVSSDDHSLRLVSREL